MTTTLKNKINPSLTTQALYGLAATAFAVILPHLCHSIGLYFGFGSALGEYLLPMHLPIILSSLLTGPIAGLISGFTAPLISFMLSGMPSAAILPFMIIELCTYGLSAGLLKDKNIPCFFKVLIAQLSARAIRAAFICTAVYVFGNTAVPVSIIYTSIITGFAGIVLQLVLIPLIVSKANRKG